MIIDMIYFLLFIATCINDRCIILSSIYHYLIYFSFLCSLSELTIYLILHLLIILFRYNSTDTYQMHVQCHREQCGREEDQPSGVPLRR